MPTASVGSHAAAPGPDEDREAFERAVEAVRLGATAQAEAKGLYDRLSDAERLGLLDGDDEIWPHLRELIAEGYNVRPYVHGEVARLGIPGTRFVDDHQTRPTRMSANNALLVTAVMATPREYDAARWLHRDIEYVVGTEPALLDGDMSCDDHGDV